MVFFGMVIMTFSLMILVLMPSISENYLGLGIFSYLVMSFRTSLGDFEMDEFRGRKVGDTHEIYPQQWLVWLVWLIIMFVGNIIFMNFLIAVVNDSYAKTMRIQKA